MKLIELPGGDIFASGAEALVNPVNTVGVMGKGLALEFKKRFPDAAKEYFQACAQTENKLEVGNVLVSITGPGPQIIIHFPTKTDWRKPSQLHYIDSGMVMLWDAIRRHNIRSIAIPALGCGLGGLQWKYVRELILGYLVNMDITLYLYPPGEPT